MSTEPTADTPAAPTGGDPQAHFSELVDWACSQITGAETLLATYTGEDSDFIRLNGDAVRQAGSVSQRSLSLDLIEGTRHADGEIRLSGDTEIDRARIAALVGQLREIRAVVPEDPYLLYATEDASSERIDRRAIPATEDALDAITAAGQGHDLVGIFAAGDTFSGFANSLGQRNWFQTATFNFDWCFYLRADKAAKNTYAGFTWDDAEFDSKVGWSSQQLEALKRDPVELSPDHYRTYLAPAAVRELTDMLAWGGFGLKAHRTKSTPLLRMATDGATMAPEVTITEATATGTAPNFSDTGFSRPDSITLIDGGSLGDHLVSPRSGKEYGIATNGANAWEAPSSLAMAPGNLANDDVLGRLNEGLFVGNLWYLNFSDRAACRTTGMTRFATFWVEGGEVVAPVNVLRFDDTVYRVLGDNLEALTDSAEVLLDPGTYHERSTDSTTVPGALVAEMSFTL